MNLRAFLSAERHNGFGVSLQLAETGAYGNIGTRSGGINNRLRCWLRSTRFVFAVICGLTGMARAQMLPSATGAGPDGTSEAAFEFETIQHPSAVQGTFVQDINDRGQAIGAYFDANGYPQGFLYQNGAFSVIRYSPATGATQPSGLNDRGQIVGWYYSQGSAPQGFLYSGGMFSTIQVPFPNSGTGTFPSAINNLGQIVGSYHDPGGLDQGFLKTGGRFILIAEPDAVQGTIATGINDEGQIVGYYKDATFQPHGFLYSNGKFTSFDDPLAGTGYYGGTYPNAINDTGEIAGFYIDAQRITHGFVYRGAAFSREGEPLESQPQQEIEPTEQRGTFSTVDDPLGSTGTNIYGLNNRGEIVGIYSTSHSTTGTYGFLATPMRERHER